MGEEARGVRGRRAQKRPHRSAPYDRPQGEDQRVATRCHGYGKSRCEDERSVRRVLLMVRHAVAV